MVLAFALGGPVWAGACCVGSTSTLPILVGECERGTLAVGLDVQQTLGHWDRAGDPEIGSHAEQAAVAMVGGAVRVNRRWQVGATLPARVNHLETSDATYWGGGPGDTTVHALWDPLEESTGPVPLVTGTVRVPTGTSAADATGRLMEDVTGLEGPAATLGASLDRSLGKTPWTLGVTGELSERPAAGAVASVGRYLNTSWSVSLSASHLRRWSGDGYVAATDGTLRLITGRPVAWRAWVQGRAGVPLASLGRSAPIEGGFGGGFVKVF